jgi:cell division protein FtsW (lipid II flippase)
MSAVTYAPAYYGDYTFPTFAEVLGWLMVCSPLACVIIGFVVQICRYGVSISNIVCFFGETNFNDIIFISYLQIYLKEFL